MRIRIASVKTVPLPINSMAIPMAGEPFPDFAPHRGRTFGPYAQLPAAILVQIRARAGLTGSRWTGRCLIPEQHLAPVLQGHQLRTAGGADVRLQFLLRPPDWPSKPSEAATSPHVWDLAGKRANLPVYQLLGGPHPNSPRQKWDKRRKTARNSRNPGSSEHPASKLLTCCRSEVCVP